MGVRRRGGVLRFCVKKTEPWSLPLREVKSSPNLLKNWDIRQLLRLAGHTHVRCWLLEQHVPHRQRDVSPA